MDPAHAVLGVFAALCGALFVFAGLLLLGLRIVRWLRLQPTDADLPEAIRYEPAPPAPRGPGPKEEAKAIASVQALRRQAHQQAHAVLDLVRGGGDPDRMQAGEVLVREADVARYREPPSDAVAATADLLVRAQALMAGPGSGRGRQSASRCGSACGA
jgi:hypothetical protein